MLNKCVLSFEKLDIFWATDQLKNLDRDYGEEKIEIIVLLWWLLQKLNWLKWRRELCPNRLTLADTFDRWRMEARQSTEVAFKLQTRPTQVRFSASVSFCDRHESNLISVMNERCQRIQQETWPGSWYKTKKTEALAMAMAMAIVEEHKTPDLMDSGSDPTEIRIFQLHLGSKTRMKICCCK